MRRKETGDLPLTRTQQIKAAQIAPVALSAPVDGHVSFGDLLVVRHVASGAALSALQSSYNTPRDDGMVVTSAAPQAAPARRNVFTVVPVDASRSGPLLYGDHFRLQSAATDTELFLFTERVTLFGGNAKHAQQQQGVVLRPSAEGPGSYGACMPRASPRHYRLVGTVWHVQCYDPQFRLEAEGQPVAANAPLLLVSSATNQALALTRQHYVRSEYGVEYETTCHTHLNAHKAEGPENHWVLELGQ